MFICTQEHILVCQTLLPSPKGLLINYDLDMRKRIKYFAPPYKDNAK